MIEVVVFGSALATFAAAVIGLMAKLRKDVREIHVMVNSRMTEALARIDQLYETLRAAGIARPDPPDKE